jgi:hypothetical protein
MGSLQSKAPARFAPHDGQKGDRSAQLRQAAAQFGQPGSRRVVALRETPPVLYSERVSCMQLVAGSNGPK